MNIFRSGPFDTYGHVKVYNLQPVTIIVERQVAVYSNQQHVLITKLFYPSYNYIIPTVKELIEVIRRAVRTITSDPATKSCTTSGSMRLC